MSKYAIGYGRVSRHGSGLSLDAQREECEAWCASTGTSMLAWVQDVDVSGATPMERREGLTRAIELIKHHHDVVLVVAAADRLARDADEARRIRAVVKAAGSDVVIANTQVTATFFSQVMEAVAMYERDIAAGLAQTVAPYGYRLVLDDDECLLRSAMTRMLEEGQSFESIADVFNTGGHMCRGQAWSAQSVEAAINGANMPATLAS